MVPVFELTRPPLVLPDADGPSRWPHLEAIDQELADVEALVAEWRQLRAAEVPAGSQSRRVAELRAELLRAGEWREVYR